MNAATILPRLETLSDLITATTTNTALTEVRALLQPGTVAILDTQTANSFERNIWIHLQGVLVQLELLKDALETDESVSAGNFRRTSRYKRRCANRAKEWARDAIAVVKRQVMLDNGECTCFLGTVNNFGGSD